jgi:hypothetical protein
VKCGDAQRLAAISADSASLSRGGRASFAVAKTYSKFPGGAQATSTDRRSA